MSLTVFHLLDKLVVRQIGQNESGLVAHVLALGERLGKADIKKPLYAHTGLLIVVMANDMTPEQIAALDPVESPCVLVCAMDRDSGHCFGCGRTMDEIAYWGLRSKAERDAIMAELPARMPPLKIKREEKRAKRRVNRRRS